MGEQLKPVQRPSRLVPYSEFLAGLGKGETTGWRWRRNGIVKTLNVCGKNYITDEEIRRFEQRAQAGEFTRECKPPRRA